MRGFFTEGNEVNEEEASAYIRLRRDMLIIFALKPGRATVKKTTDITNGEGSSQKVTK